MVDTCAKHLQLGDPIFFQKQLRIYPQGFADQVRSLFPALIGGEGMPDVDHTVSAQSLFHSLAWDTWKEAELMPCIKYVRGNKHLNAPQEWKDVFPRSSK